MKLQLTFPICLALLAAPLAKAQTIDDFVFVYNLIDDNFNNGRTLVRLAFHDAMGGVDGTVNQGDPEHNGLAGTIQELDQLWTNNQGSLPDGFTRADFFAWSYIAGFYMAIPNNNAPWVPLSFGRSNFEGVHQEDVPPGSDRGSGQHSQVLAYFSEHFGFDAREMAVILGAHTLGGAEEDNSGYIENWTGNQNRFDNEYYETLIDPGNPGWEQVQVPGSGKFQWMWDCNGNPAENNLNGCRDLMLNVDMNLFIDIESFLDPDGSGRVINQCNGDRVFADCFPQRNGEDTHTAVVQFENNGNNNQFVEEFAGVFGRMIERVKINAGAGLAFIDEPANWPAQIGGGGGGNNGGGGGGNNNDSSDDGNNGGGNGGGGGGNNNDSSDDGNNGGGNGGGNNNNDSSDDGNNGGGNGGCRNNRNRRCGDRGDRGDGGGRDGNRGDGNRGDRGGDRRGRSANFSTKSVATKALETTRQDFNKESQEQVAVVKDYTDDFGLPITEKDSDFAASETSTGGEGVDSYSDAAEPTPADAAANLRPALGGLYSSGGSQVHPIIPSLTFAFGTLLLLK